jgi:hypothetical protein
VTAHIPPPDFEAALVTAGALCHYIASSPRRAEEFARFIEHCPGDLDGPLIIAYLSDVHDLLAPGCPVPATMSELTP